MNRILILDDKQMQSDNFDDEVFIMGYLFKFPESDILEIITKKVITHIKLLDGNFMYEEQIKPFYKE